MATRKHTPQQHSGSADKPSPSEYTVKTHPGAKPGEWQGHYEPVKSEKHKKSAQATLAKQLVAAQYATPRPADVARQVRETRSV